MRAADFIVDVGPKAGRRGGRIVAAGTHDDILRADSVTADYLTGRRKIELPETLRKGTGERIVIRGARGNNLRGITATFPLGKFICVTGVSGSGKSTLVNETLRPILSRALYRALRPAARIRRGGGHRAHRQAGGRRPVAHRPLAALEPRDLLERLRRHPQALRNDARRPDSRLQGRPLLVQRQGRPLRGVPRRGVQTIEMNFLPDVIRHLQGVRRPPLQPRDAGGEVQGARTSTTC